MKTKYLFAFFLIFAPMILTGFTCGFVGVETAYQLDKCPPSGFSLPDSNHLGKGEIKVRKYNEESYECRKLKRYEFEGPIFADSDKVYAYDAYVGIFQNGNSCKFLITSIYHGASGEDSEKTRKGFAEQTKAVTKTLFHGLPIQPRFPPENTRVVAKNKKEYIDWCNKLPGVESK